jgi:hypothetical protein
MTAQQSKTLDFAYQLLEDVEEFYSDITAESVEAIISMAKAEGLAETPTGLVTPEPTYAWDAMSGETLATICIYQNGETNLLSIV